MGTFLWPVEFILKAVLDDLFIQSLSGQTFLTCLIEWS